MGCFVRDWIAPLASRGTGGDKSKVVPDDRDAELAKAEADAIAPIHARTAAVGSVKSRKPH